MDSSSRFAKTAHIAIIALFIVLFVYGISNVREYGRSWDEPFAITILQSNWIEYEIRLLPEGSELRQQAEASYIPPISQYFEKDHGCAPYYAFAPLFGMFKDDTASLVYAWHTYTFCLFFLSTVVVWFLLKEIYGSKIISTAGMLFFYFTPRFFGEGHYNDKDLVFLGLIMTCMLFAIRAAKKLASPDTKKGWGDIVCFSVFSGFMMNVKIIGLAIWGLIGLFTILYVLTRGEKVKIGVWVKIALTACISFVFYILLTPASWAGVIDFFTYLVNNAVHYTEWDSYLRFRGTLFRPVDIGMPYSYFPLWMLITIPVYITMLFAASVLDFIIVTVKEKGKNILKENADFWFLMLLIGFMAPFCFVVLKSHSAIFYNSWRHLYFLYAFMLPGTLYFPGKLIENYRLDPAKKNKLKLTVVSALTGIAFLTCSGEMIMNRSYEYVYYNLLSRQIIDVNGYEGDYWMVSVVQSLRGFADEYYDGENPLKVACVLFEVHGAEASMLDENKIMFVSPEEADYLVYNPSGSYDWPEAGDHEKVYSENHYGVELTGIYRK